MVACRRSSITARHVNKQVSSLRPVRRCMYYLHMLSVSVTRPTQDDGVTGDTSADNEYAHRQTQTTTKYNTQNIHVIHKLRGMLPRHGLVHVVWGNTTRDK